MNFNEVEIKGGFEPKYVSTGPNVIKFTEIKAGNASTGTQYLEFTAEDAGKLTISDRLYFKPGKNTEISVQSLYAWIAVTNGFDLSKEEDKTKVKATIGDFASYDDLAKKLSSLLINKPFAMLVKGEYVDNKDATKDSWIKGKLSSVVKTKEKVSELPSFDATKHVAGDFVKGTGASNGVVATHVEKW